MVSSVNTIPRFLSRQAPIHVFSDTKESYKRGKRILK